MQENLFTNMKDTEKKYQRKINLYADLIKLEKEEKLKSSKLLKEIDLKKKELENLKNEYTQYKNSVSLKRRNIKYDLKNVNLLKNTDTSNSFFVTDVVCKKCGCSTVTKKPTRMYSGEIVMENKCTKCGFLISIEKI